MTRLIVEVYARKDCKLCGYYKKHAGCALCKDVASTINKVNSDIPFHFKEVDINGSEDLFRRFKEDIPTVYINGRKAFKFKVDEAEFRKVVRKEIIKVGMQRLWDKKQHYS